MAMNLAEGARRVQVSYRQVDHWRRKGYLGVALQVANPGSGVPIELTRAQFRQFAVLAALVRLGMGPERAAEMAAGTGATLIEAPEVPLVWDAGQGVVLTVEPTRLRGWA